MFNTPTVSSTDLMNEAEKLKRQAIAVLQKTDYSAEDQPQVEKLRAAAAALLTRSAAIQELESQIGAYAEQQRLAAPRPQSADATKFASFGEFLQAVARAEKGAPDARLRYHFDEAIATKDMSQDSGSGGGYLVQPEFRDEILAIAAPLAVVRPRARVIPMAARTLAWPVLRQTGTTAGQPHWYGGMLTYWEGEEASINTADMLFDNLNFTAWRMSVLTYLSREQLDDAVVSVEAFLRGALGMGGAFAWKEDLAFLRGNGVGQPLGVLNAPVTISPASRTTASTIKYLDLVGMLNLLLPTATPIWVANVGTRSALMQMEGPSGNPSYLWGDALRGIPNTLLGYPIVFIDKLPAMGTQGDIMLCDFSHYYIGDRQMMTVETDTSVRFVQHQVAFKGVQRLDGKPWMKSFFTLDDGATQLSPFVDLVA